MIIVSRIVHDTRKNTERLRSFFKCCCYTRHVNAHICMGKTVSPHSCYSCQATVWAFIIAAVMACGSANRQLPTPTHPHTYPHTYKYTPNTFTPPHTHIYMPTRTHIYIQIHLHTCTPTHVQTYEFLSQQLIKSLTFYEYLYEKARFYLLVNDAG